MSHLTKRTFVITSNHFWEMPLAIVIKMANYRFRRVSWLHTQYGTHGHRLGPCTPINTALHIRLYMSSVIGYTCTYQLPCVYLHKQVGTNEK